MSVGPLLIHKFPGTKGCIHWERNPIARKDQTQLYFEPLRSDETRFSTASNEDPNDSDLM
jgi:hypothetical protein